MSTATRYGPHVTADPYGHIRVEPVDPDARAGNDPLILIDFGSHLDATVGRHSHGSTRLDPDTARHLAAALRPPKCPTCGQRTRPRKAAVHAEVEHAWETEREGAR